MSKTLLYTLIINGPRTEDDPTGARGRAKFHSRSPIPIPRVGEDIESAIVFGVSGTRAQRSCRVTKVQHSINPGATGAETDSIVTIWTEEYEPRDT